MQRRVLLLGSFSERSRTRLTPTSLRDFTRGGDGHLCRPPHGSLTVSSAPPPARSSQPTPSPRHGRWDPSPCVVLSRPASPPRLTRHANGLQHRPAEAGTAGSARAGSRAGGSPRPGPQWRGRAGGCCRRPGHGKVAERRRRRADSGCKQRCFHPQGLERARGASTLAGVLGTRYRDVATPPVARRRSPRSARTEPARRLGR
jgi:hypothetical protein